MKSKSPLQLSGENLGYSGLDECSPVITNDEMGVTGKLSLTNTTLIGSDPAIPCGLIAKSIFNDTFSIFNSSGQAIAID